MKGRMKKKNILFDVNKRVDINKWLYMNCVQTHGENWESVNLKGSYSCVCKLGFNPVNNGCIPI
ncbi:calcium binding EGF domain-containing protein [Wuchereria bancrofti]|uniref:Calcium binding EGF domain-containing protein n=1 Tax=Wuchereria bancrofti TaxID=6293 RepID=J9F2W8_WUCBA|nr:calcium binding EGF domain-containing protein [Wuchereria bancrofti]